MTKIRNRIIERTQGKISESFLLKEESGHHISMYNERKQRLNQILTEEKKHLTPLTVSLSEILNMLDNDIDIAFDPQYQETVYRKSKELAGIIQSFGMPEKYSPQDNVMNQSILADLIVFYEMFGLTDIVAQIKDDIGKIDSYVKGKRKEITETLGCMTKAIQSMQGQCESHALYGKAIDFESVLKLYDNSPDILFTPLHEIKERSRKIIRDLKSKPYADIEDIVNCYFHLNKCCNITEILPDFSFEEKTFSLYELADPYLESGVFEIRDLYMKDVQLKKDFGAVFDLAKKMLVKATVTVNYDSRDKILFISSPQHAKPHKFYLSTIGKICDSYGYKTSFTSGEGKSKNPLIMSKPYASLKISMK